MDFIFRVGVVLAATTGMVTSSLVFAAESTAVPREKIEKCLMSDSAALRNKCYDTICSFSLTCARGLVTAATEARGPIIGTLVLNDLHGRGDRTVTKDGHDLQHQVGRVAARTSAGDWETFLKCPDDFFLGCKHGFFEAMLGELGSSVDAASEVCTKAPRTERTFCFHGMGHGIMMAAANDVERSVLVCDKLRGSRAQRGCYQGVFMENVNAAGRGETRIGVLDPDDVLAPCTRMDPKYRTECFGQHADYVLKSLSGSLLSVVEACEGAQEEQWIRSCVRHVGQNMTTYDYQMKYLGTFDLSTAPAGAVMLCSRFPERWQTDCRAGAAHNFMLYDQPEQAVTFCNLTDSAECGAVVIPYFSRPMYSSEYRVSICAKFSDSDVREKCLHPVWVPFKRELGTALVATIVLVPVLILLARSRIKKKA